MSPDSSRRRGSGARRRSQDDSVPSQNGFAVEKPESDRVSTRRASTSAGSDDPEQPARDAVYRLLATRARSESELRQALLRKEIEPEVTESVLQKFVNAGLIDDAAFAESWVRERHQNQGLGRKALGYELRRKGVEEGLVAEALSHVDEGSEDERARELVRRKLPSMNRVDQTARTRRLVGMLARKGYSEGLAFRIVREEIEQAGFDETDVSDELS